jgi:hypothetical protein
MITYRKCKFMIYVSLILKLLDLYFILKKNKYMNTLNIIIYIIYNQQLLCGQKDINLDKLYHIYYSLIIII